MAENVYKLQTSFNGGEYSPQIEGRPDLAKFFTGCKTLENFLLWPEGGAFARYGTKLVKEGKDSAKKTTLVDFKFNISQAYAIEAGHLYFRFYRRGFGGNNNLTQITTSAGGPPVEVVTPYTENDLEELQWVQSADVLYLVHPSYQQRKLSRVSDTSWSLGLFNADPPPSFEADTSLAQLGAPNANTGTGKKFRAKGSPFLAADSGRQLISGAGKAIITAVDSADQVSIDILDDFAATITAGPNTLTSVGTAVTSTAHGLAVDNFVVLTSGAQAGEIRRVTVVGGVDSFTIDAAFSLDQAGQSWNKVIAFASGAWLLRGSPQTTLDPNIKGPVGAQVTLVAGAAALRAADVGKFIKIYGGLVKITILDSPTQVRGQILSELSNAADANPAAAPAGSWTLEVASWSDARGWPSAVEFHQGRLWFAGTATEPTTKWGSFSNDFENFAVGSLPASAVQYPIANRSVNVIEWLKSMKQLFIGDAENEHIAKGPGTDQPLGGDVIPFVSDEGDEGSMSTMALLIKRAIIFLHAFGKKVLQFTFNLEEDGFRGENLTLFARHICGPDGFAQHPPTYAKEPDSTVYIPRNDGQVACMTYDRAQAVYGWSRWITDGVIESVRAIPNRLHGKHDVIMIVRRTINGQTKRFIECVVGPEDTAVAHATARKWVEYQTDCGIDGTVSGGFPVSTIGGLAHLEGKQVDVVLTRGVAGGPYSGSYKGLKTVAGGQITLTDPIEETTHYEIGLHYSPKLVTMRPAIDGVMIEGRKRKWNKIFVRLKESVSARVNGVDLQLDIGGAAMDEGPQPFNGDKEVTGQDWDLDGYITIERPAPQPLQILSLFGSLAVVDQM